MRAPLNIFFSSAATSDNFLPKKNKSALMTIKNSHEKSLNGLINSNMEANEDQFTVEFVSKHIHTTSGLLIVVRIMIIMFCINKMVRKD